MTRILSYVAAATILLASATAGAAFERSVTGRNAWTDQKRSNQGLLGNPRQSLKPTPGEIRGLGSGVPDLGGATGTPGGPKYYPRAMRPIEPQ